MRALLLLSLFLMAGTCRSPSEAKPPSLNWNNERAAMDLKELSRESHPMGSPRIKVLAEYIEKEMKSAGLETGLDAFTSLVPDPELLGAEANPMRSLTLSMPMINITARYLSPTAENCTFLLASHYDSKRLPEGPSLGANDSGSSTVALMELMRSLNASKPNFRCHVMAVWFDGEEAYLPEWRDGESRHPARIVDNTYGSRHFVGKLKSCGQNSWCLPSTSDESRVEGLILLDMVGMADLRLSPESRSTPSLLALAIELDKSMFGGQLYGRSSPKAVEDDHIPFLEKGIPALDLIGFENLDTWHQTSDTFERVSMKSVQQAAELTDAILQRILGK